jgi:hypothetical protein
LDKRGNSALILALLQFVLLALLALAAGGKEEGQKARETVEQAGENAADFAEGLCGAIIVAPLAIFLVSVVRRRSGR